MRRALAVGILVAAISGSSAPSLPGPGFVRVTATAIRQQRSFGDRTTVSLIYNKRIVQHSIGNAILSCDYVGRGGPLGSGTQLCEAVYSMPHGKILASGVVKLRSFYILGVTGGTGLYSNVGGEVVVSTFACCPRQERLLFSLETLG
jgi:hypothetical protein